MRGFKVAYCINGELVSPYLMPSLILCADDLVLLAPDRQSQESALLVLEQVARRWSMSVNYDKAIGVVVTRVVTPPTAASASYCRDYSRPPNRVEIQGYLNYTFTAACSSRASRTGQQSHGHPSRAPRLPNWRPSTTPACAA